MSTDRVTILKLQEWYPDSRPEKPPKAPMYCDLGETSYVTYIRVSDRVGFWTILNSDTMHMYGSFQALGDLYFDQDAPESKIYQLLPNGVKTPLNQTPRRTSAALARRSKLWYNKTLISTPVY